MRPVIVALAVCLAGMPLFAGEEAGLLENERITATTLRSWILEIHEMPCGHPYLTGEPRYWELVRLGLERVPDLIELIDDPTPTEARVCLFGGYWAVGDVARSAAGNIVHRLPSLELIAPLDSPRVVEIGFGVYWEFVRASDENRQLMEQKIWNWFEENKHRLVWKAVEEHPSGGHYVLRGDDDG